MRGANKHLRITTNGTTTLVPSSCALVQLVISCSNAGTAWTLKIQDKSGSPAIIVAPFTLAVAANGQPAIIPFASLARDFIGAPRGIRMQGGIDIVTAGTTPGVLDVWADVTQADQ